MRPFGWLVLGSAVCNVLAIARFETRFRADAVEHGTAPGAWLLAILITVVINGLLWRAIAIGASNVARWVYLALVVLSSLDIPRVYALVLRYGWLYGVLMGSCYAFEFASAALLLRAKVGRWLRSRGRDGEVDVAVFD